MIDLRPLIVVTGTIRIDGGEKNTVRQQRGSTRRTDNGRKLVVVHEMQITSDRLGADVIATGYARRVLRMRILKTPFGALVDPGHLDKVKAMLTRATADVAAFNAAHTRSKLANCMLWEPLRGNRLDAVRGWIDRQIADGNEEVRNVVPLLALAEEAA